MFFLQAAMAPVPLRYKHGIYMVPKMTMDELIVWATEVRTERLEMQTMDMADSQRREHMSLYPPTEPDIKEMSVLVNTPSGIKRVLRACLPKAKGIHYKTRAPIPELTDQEIEEIFTTNSTGRMSGLAWELIDIKDTSQVNPYDDASNGDEEDPTKGTRTEQSAA